VTSSIAFVANKRPDIEKVASLLGRSASANHWTNFGPVWRDLKAFVESELELPADRCAIPTASGTHALSAAAALSARDGITRWVVSSYGFRATVIGPFAGATIVDCDAGGLIDLAAVGMSDAQGYDGILATNPLGILGDMNETVAFARQAGKALILDNAAAFIGFDRSDHGGVFECLSFHHTKPFGFGEGGCLIVDRALEVDAMAAMDFGYRWTSPAGQNALSNGKLSDPAAAFILAHQLDHRAWVPAYQMQFQRILRIGERRGFRLLVDRNRIGCGAYGNVPLLCPEPVPLENIANAKLTLQKYYKPLGGGPVSHDLYSRVVNVPCHPDVAALADDALDEMLERIRERGLART
jgi:hypothetical protein